MDKYYLYGASGHGKVILEILQCNHLSVAGVFDDSVKGLMFGSIPLLGAFTNEKINKGFLIISVGDNAARKMLVQKTGASFGRAIHPASVISTSAFIGEGTAVMAGAVVNAEAVIGNHVILNTNSSIDHHCVIEDYVHIAPNTALAGAVKVGEGSLLGIGTAVIPGVKIGKWCTIGAGSVVIADLPDYAVAVGAPAKIIKYNNKI